MRPWVFLWLLVAPAPGAPARSPPFEPEVPGPNASVREAPRASAHEIGWLLPHARETIVACSPERPVLATLVSSGREDPPTPEGLFRVVSKLRSIRMHGDDHFIEEVPWVLFFEQGIGLHEAFWHDRFGRPASHGCVNLSPSDARWLFDWAPPSLPASWRARFPLPGDESLWVNVRRRPRATWPVVPKLVGRR